MKRVEFCKKMIEKNISGKNILFTDEAIIDIGCYTHDSIRLSDDNKKKIKKRRWVELMNLFILFIL